MFEKELETAIDAARLAGKVILEHYALEIIAEEKLGVDNFYEPVTAADRAASAMIVGHLSAAFPQDAVLSEEVPDDAKERLSHERAWIIDPIDGTAGFVKKDGDFGVQIGLVVRGEPVVGVVLLPFHGILYYASKGGGAFRIPGNGPAERMHVSSKTDFSKMDLAITRHHSSRNMTRVLEEFQFRRLTHRGSVGLKVGLLAEGVCDIYIHPSPRTKIWDTCGPQVILEEAGGRLTDLFGMPLDYASADLQNHNGILATNGTAHADAVKRMRPILDEFGRHPVPAKNLAAG
jgi:3'(2'), 5'-bisphosphate nucleotidase